ncbi:MAG: hypothetical protein IH596_00630 [Bacteroidales bacterium]|nr:hypothetical protein [Bacteroidales bacterium]
MNRSLRKSSRYLVFPVFFIASLAFAYELLLPVISEKQPSSPPDSTYTAKLPAPDSVYQSLLGPITDLYNQQRYEECLVLLKKANTLKPGVRSIQERTIRVEGLIAQQKKTNEEYSRMIIMADGYFEKKDYLNAKASYQMAIDIKPSDAYAKERMNKTMGLLRSNKAQNILYDVTIASADKLFAERDYEKAKSQYENASSMLPGEAYPKEKINTIIKILVDQQVREELYLQAITAADNFYNSTSFQRALLEYQKALQQKPNEPYPKERIEELKTKLAELAALEAAYKEAIAQADKLFSEVRYPDARSSYEEALTLKPKEVYPAEKIREIDGIVAQIAKDQADFENFVNIADSFYMDKNFIRARQNYQLALKIKPNESYPKAMLAKTVEGVGSQQANELAMEEAYHAAISNADRLFADQAFPQARAEYENALAVKPEEVYPQQKIAEIGTLMAAALLKQQELDAQYIRILENADRMFSDNLYPQAKGQYKEALKLKPEESYPAEKILELDGILANLEQQQAIDAQYKAVLTEANKLFAARTYETAKTEYEKALGIKPSESLPALRIQTIDSILRSIANREALENNYAELIAAADAKFGLLEYQAAKITYQEALALKPKESYPAAKIKEVDALLNQMALDEKREADYTLAVARGDSLLETKAYTEAKGAFQTASTLKPTESYPPTKIAEIDGILAELARLQSLSQQYDDAIASADQLFEKAEWQQARGVYLQAQSLKPAEPYPAKQLVVIDQKLEEIARQLALEQQNLKALEEKYAALISSSDTFLSDKEYQSAREGYIQAKSLKPAENYPSVKVAEIDVLLAEIERIAALDRQYARTIERGDSLMSASRLIPARAEFETAKSLKPEEAYPKQKLEEIDATIKLEIARQLKIDSDFNALITHADQLFSDRSLDSARMDYARAGELRPENSYWQDQIAEINRMQAEINRVNEEYKAAVTSADLLFAEQKYENARDGFQNAAAIKPSETYPREKIKEINQKIAEIEGLRQTFDKLVVTGDLFFTGKEYFRARENFEQALDLFPDEQHPKERLRITNVKIDSIYRANKADYDKAVGEGDGFFNTYEYDRSIDAFTRAISFLPNEDYPRMMIAKIRKTISENAIADVLTTTVVIKEGEQQKFSFEPVNISSRRNNFIYLKVRNLSDKSFNILIRYGKGDQTSGGLAIRNISTDGEVNERLISVKDQDPWYREDNNWISLYPQGGDIEVSFIQVSRAIN